MKRFFPYICVLAWFIKSNVLADIDRVDMPFSITWDVGFGSNVYVVGNHPDLGEWDPTLAHKLRWTSGNVWTGQVGIASGAAIEFKYIARDGGADSHCDPDNVVWEPGDNRLFSTPTRPPPPASGKTIYYYSGWTSAVLVVISPTGHASRVMNPVGPGRSSDETLFKVKGVGTQSEMLEFHFEGWLDNVLYQDFAPYPDFDDHYFTRLDAFLLQDGQLYTYWPSPTVSAPRFEDRWINSSYPPIDGRNIRIWLPRGYDSHPWKRYPVIYFQDGQNIYYGADPSGTGGWDADVTAQREISQGRMREAIIVAIDNIPDRRRWEYNPLGDTYPGESAGRADAYVNFLAHNVRPTLDFHYRTLPDRRNTFVAGSSMGGIFSVYALFETNVFGGALAMSPAFTRAPNYTAMLPAKTKPAANVYMDTGAAEGQVGVTPGGNYWETPWEGYDALLTQGFVPNKSLSMQAGCGHSHTESAWRARLPDAFRWLLSAGDEPNRIALQEWPPDLNAFSVEQGVLATTQRGGRYRIETASDPDTWMEEGPAWVETNRWDQRWFTLDWNTSPAAWKRLTVEPQY